MPIYKKANEFVGSLDFVKCQLKNKNTGSFLEEIAKYKLWSFE
jgi:hypothetical protein